MAGEPWYRWRGDDLELRIQAKTRSRDEGLGMVTGDAVPVRVSAPPVEGKANKRILAVLANAFGVAGSRVRLIRGARSKHKWVRIEQPPRVPEPLKDLVRRPSEVDQCGKGD